MAFLRYAPPPRHQNWLQAPALAYDPYQGRFGPPGPRRHVGALSPTGVLELGKQGIDLSDQIVRDLDIPVMQQALDLLDKVYLIADELGVGAEVRTAITAIRGAEYAGVAASAILPPSAAAAGGGVLLGIGAVAALGAIGVVAAAASAIFGSSSADEAAQKATKRAQAEVLHLRDRLSISELAAEQDDTAAQEMALSTIPYGPASPQQHKAAAARAAKLADFYRALSKSLTASELRLFESLSNLARWTAALRTYDKLSQSQKDGVDVMFGKGAPRLPYQLKGPIEKESKRLGALTNAVQLERAASIPTIGLLAAAGAAAVYAAVSPGRAAALARGAGSKVYQGGAAAVRKVRGIV